MKALALLAVLLLASCGGGRATTVATDLVTTDKPVLSSCEIEWPAVPTPYVDNVQLTGIPEADALLVWRAAEAELEDRIRYEKLLEAAARKCVEGR